jgi:inner membrane protein YhjD
VLERIKASARRLTATAPVQVALAVQKRYGKDSAGNLSAVVTYFGFLSLFPLILLGLAVVGFVLAGEPATQNEWATKLSDAVPGLGPLIGRNIESVVESRGPATLVGAGLLLWAGIAIVEAAGWAVSRVYRVPEYQGFLKKKLWSIATLVALGVLWLVSTSVAGFAANVDLGRSLDLLVQPVGGLVAFALDFVLFMVAYRLLVQGRGPTFRQLWPGSLLAATGWFLLKLLGSWYATRTVTTSSAVYGTFGAVIGVLVLLYLAARVFMYGAELNAVLIERKEGAPMEGKERDTGELTTSVSPNGDGTPTTVPATPPTDRSTLELIRGIASDTGTLVKKEVELAKQEIAEGVVTKAKAAGAFGAAGVMALFAVGFIGMAGAWALSRVLPIWAGFLIVGGVFLAIAGTAALIGKRGMSQSSVAPEKTKQTVKEDVEWAKEALRR